MKKLIFTLALALCFGMSYGQIKVISNGNTGIGTSTPTYKLHVNNDGANQVALFESDACAAQLLFNSTGAGGKQWRFMSTANCASLGGGKYTVFEDGGAHRFVIASGGNTGIGTTSPSAKLDVNGIVKHGGLMGPSDRRLKENIQDLPYGLAEIMRLDPKSYEWNGRAGMAKGKLQVGVMAQDLQKVIPEVVSEWTFVDDLDDKSRNADNFKTFLGVQTDAIQYVLVNAVKEQQTQIEDLKSEIEELKALVKTVTSSKEVSQDLDVSLVGIADASMGQNVPNPFNGETQINYAVNKDFNSASIRFMDNNGQLIHEEAITEKGAGVVNLTATRMAAGVYQYALVIDGEVQETKAMILAK